MPNSQRYLVAPAQAGGAGQPNLLDAVRQAIAAHPGAAVVPQPGGGASHLVVEMEAEAAQKLKAQFGSGLIIEPDAPLRY